MAIRKMNFSDLNQVVKLYKDANQFARINDIKDWTEEGLSRYPDYSLVYEQHGKIVGAISAIKKGKSVIEINDISVLKSSRNKKVGTKLMNSLFDIIFESNVRKISLWVHWSNAAAIPFYYRFGFRINRYLKTKNMPGVPDGEDIICLEKFL